MNGAHMNYPDWAPQSLVDRHKSRTDSQSSERKFKTSDPETIIADILRKHDGDITEENVEDIRRKLYRNSLSGLPDRESTALLELLITDLRMKDVWKALVRRVEDDREFLHFFSACEGGIAGWRGAQKQTASERRSFYQETYDAAARLQSLMSKASEFDFYSINDLVDDRRVEWLLEVLDASPPLNGKDEASYARFCLSDVVPSIFQVLGDIGEKAKQYGEEEPLVKKPNSPNAEIHYFTRCLSAYCQRRYNQPLHDVVAITTSVIFDLPNIDADYIRKIVKR